jgi:hypothetical protein
MEVRYTTYCYLHVRPANQPKVTCVVLCHIQVGRLWASL